MKIYYENSMGTVLDLANWPIAIEDVTKLFGKDWAYESVENKEKNKEKLEKFYRTKYEKEINIQVFADSEQEFERIADEIEEVTEYDVANETPGKIWCGNYYMECFVTQTEPEEYEELFYTMDIKAKLLSINPFWIKESEYGFKYGDVTTSRSKRYPWKYAYRYANGMNEEYIVNKQMAGSNFKLRIYGPAVNPQIAIGGNIYLVNIILEEEERLEIDSREEDIVKIKRNGEQINAFHNRKKGKEFFAKIPYGRQSVSWNGKFDFDVVIYEERSQPRWSE